MSGTRGRPEKWSDSERHVASLIAQRRAGDSLATSDLLALIESRLRALIARREESASCGHFLQTAVAFLVGGGGLRGLLDTYDPAKHGRPLDDFLLPNLVTLLWPEETPTWPQERSLDEVRRGPDGEPFTRSDFVAAATPGPEDEVTAEGPDQAHAYVPDPKELVRQCRAIIRKKDAALLAVFNVRYGRFLMGHPPPSLAAALAEIRSSHPEARAMKGEIDLFVQEHRMLELLVAEGLLSRIG